MIIEFLYNELMLYGEDQNEKYFKLLFPEATIVTTRFNEIPSFVNQEVDMLYIGPMAEDWLSKVADKLRPHKERLKEIIDNGTLVFIVNNALDIFCESLEIKNALNNYEKTEPLGILPIKAVRDYDVRKTRHTAFTYNNETVYATHIGFSEYFGNENNYVYESVEEGWGFNYRTKLGGYRINNCFGIEVCGLFFLSNPYLIKQLLTCFNRPIEIPLLDEIQLQYDRCKEFVKIVK